MAKKTENISVNAIAPKEATITIKGESTLCLNKMNHQACRLLIGKQTDTFEKEVPNPFEQLGTSIHWLNWHPSIYESKGMTQEDLERLFKEDTPCITSFGLKKSFCQAVTRNEIDQYSTKFDNAISFVDDLIPIKYGKYYMNERLMSPQRGAPVLTRLNYFQFWEASFKIKYIESVYTIEQIAKIIDLAGFGIGTGSGRPSGYGRFKVVDVKF